jgi:hypothetical protein
MTLSDLSKPILVTLGLGLGRSAYRVTSCIRPPRTELGAGAAVLAGLQPRREQLRSRSERERRKHPGAQLTGDRVRVSPSESTSGKPRAWRCIQFRLWGLEP